MLETESQVFIGTRGTVLKKTKNDAKFLHPNLKGQCHEIFGGVPWLANISANVRKNRNDPNVIFRGLGEGDSWKKPEAKNLVTLSLYVGTVQWYRGETRYVLGCMIRAGTGGFRLSIRGMEVVYRRRFYTWLGVATWQPPSPSLPPHRDCRSGNRSSGKSKISSEMEITKKKNPQASLQIFCRFVNPYPSLWMFYWKSQRFGKSLRNFGSRIFLRFIKSIGWCRYGFKFEKRCFIKVYLWKHTLFVLYDGVLCAEEIHRLGPVDLKIYNVEKTRDYDSTADKIHRISPKLSMWLQYLGVPGRNLTGPWIIRLPWHGSISFCRRSG
jgi:hypothetical protein